MEGPPQAPGPSSGQSSKEPGAVEVLCREEPGGLCRGSGSGRLAAMLQLRKSLPRPFKVNATDVTKQG